MICKKWNPANWTIGRNIDRKDLSSASSLIPMRKSERKRVKIWKFPSSMAALRRQTIPFTAPHMFCFFFFVNEFFVAHRSEISNWLDIKVIQVQCEIFLHLFACLRHNGTQNNSRLERKCQVDIYRNKYSPSAELACDCFGDYNHNWCPLVKLAWA